MKIIIDTNILFSAIINSQNKIGDLIIQSNPYYQIYAPEYVFHELDKHKGKLLKASKLNEENLSISTRKITSYIRFVNEIMIPRKIWLYSENMVQDIDIDDIAFVAMTKFLNGNLWTGDKLLYAGLKAKLFDNVLSTNELFAIRELLRIKKNK